jgi:hypothetical protein
MSAAVRRIKYSMACLFVIQFAVAFVVLLVAMTVFQVFAPPRLSGPFDREWKDNVKFSDDRVLENR